LQAEKHFLLCIYNPQPPTKTHLQTIISQPPKSFSTMASHENMVKQLKQLYQIVQDAVDEGVTPARIRDITRDGNCAPIPLQA